MLYGNNHYNRMFYKILDDMNKVKKFIQSKQFDKAEETLSPIEKIAIDGNKVRLMVEVIYYKIKIENKDKIHLREYELY